MKQEKSARQMFFDFGYEQILVRLKRELIAEIQSTNEALNTEADEYKQYWYGTLDAHTKMLARVNELTT